MKMVVEDLKMSYGQYIEDIRDRVLVQKVSYEGEDMGLIAS